MQLWRLELVVFMLTAAGAICGGIHDGGPAMYTCIATDTRLVACMHMASEAVTSCGCMCGCCIGS